MKVLFCIPVFNQCRICWEKTTQMKSNGNFKNMQALSCFRCCFFSYRTIMLNTSIVVFAVAALFIITAISQMCF